MFGEFPNDLKLRLSYCQNRSLTAIELEEAGRHICLPFGSHAVTPIGGTPAHIRSATV